MTDLERIQKEYDAKLAELDRLIAENNAKLAANHLALFDSATNFFHPALRR